MQKHSRSHVRLSIEVENALFEDVCQRHSIEACGLLLGTIDMQGNWEIERAYPLRNTHNSSVYFEFAPEDLLAAELDNPEKIVGVYHSHPSGLARASDTDRENMQRVNSEQEIPWVWLIISGPFRATFQQKHTIRSSVVAYHHYKKIGLRQIDILFDDQCATKQTELSPTDSESIG